MPARGGEAQLAVVFSATSNEELRNAYDQWAERYDADLRDFGYTYPAPMAGLVCRYVADRAAPILDAGAGTGAVGEVLAILGYMVLVGIDLSERMLDVARRKRVYAELRNQVLGQPLDFPDDRFAATVSAGVLTVGHAPPDSLDELIRVTRPGGHLIFTISTPAYESGGFRDKLAALTAAGRWREVEVTRLWHPLPNAPSEASLTARAYVYAVR
jgi:SAM-dependent methyltransferase